MARKVAPDNEMRMFFDRRHPGYADLEEHWDFLTACYNGGRTWFKDNIFRYHKEGEIEYTARLQRAYRFNHTREVVDLVQKYLFKAPITRNVTDASDILKQFWNSATRGGMNINQFMRTVSTSNSIGGRVAVVVDNNFKHNTATDADGVVTLVPLSQRQAAESKFRIYAYVVKAQDVLDYAWDEDGDGELLWIKLREIVRDDSDPHTSTGEVVERVRLWTRLGWELYQETANTVKGEKPNVVLKDSGSHDLGFVPVRLVDHAISENPYNSQGLIDDIAYMDRTISNYLSNLDAIIQDQTFSQLAIPAQAVQQGDDMHQKITEMGTKRVFVYDSGQGSSAAPFFLSPDPKQAGVIISTISKIINEIYHTIGLAGERTKEDNAVGIDNSSGVAKAYDFERVNSLLLSKAQSCMYAENWIVNTVLAWAGEPPPQEELVSYPDSFDVTSLSDDLVIAEALAKILAPTEVRREQMAGLVDKLLPQLSEEKRGKITASLEEWLSTPDTGGPAPIPTPSTGIADKPVAAPSRQGSVTAATK